MLKRQRDATSLDPTSPSHALSSDPIYIEDRTDQRCGLAAINEHTDLPIVQLAEWDGTLPEGTRIAFRFDHYDNGKLVHLWKIGVVQLVHNAEELLKADGDAADVSVEFFNRLAFPGMNAAAVASVEVLQLRRNKFGDGTYLEHNWFIVVERAEHLQKRFEEVSTAHRVFRQKFTLQLGQAVSNGHCGVGTFAQFIFDVESPETMKRVRNLLSASLQTNIDHISRLVAGGAQSVESVKAELLSRAKMHLAIDCSRPCSVNEWVGGSHGADFIAASMSPEFAGRPIYYCREQDFLIYICIIIKVKWY